MSRYSDPYRTTAKFNSKCSNCGKPIKKADPIVYDKYKGKVYCDKCEAGEQIMEGLSRERSMDAYGTDIY
jgi:hypothetical protein